MFVACGGAESSSADGTPSAEAAPPAVTDVYREALLTAADPQRLDEAVGRLREAVSARAAGETTLAAVLFEEAALSPALADWAGLLAAEALAGTGDTSAVRTRLDALPVDLRHGRGWRPRMAAARAAGDSTGALILVLDALERIPLAVDSAEAHLELAEAWFTRGDTVAARRHWRASLAAAPSGWTAPQAVRSLAGLPSLEVRGLELIAASALARGDAVRAGWALDRLDRVAPREAADLTAQWVALELAEGRAVAAERRATRLAGLVDDPEVRARLLVLASQARRALGRTAGARAGLREAIDLATDPGVRQDALLALAELESDPGRAAVLRRAALHLMPGSVAGVAAAMRLGTDAYAAGAFLDAAGAFETSLEADPPGWRQQQLAYWAGLAWRQEGEPERARARLEWAAGADPTVYYAVRAAEALGRDPGSAFVALPEGPERNAGVDALAEGALARVDALSRAGLEDEAQREERRVRVWLGTVPGALHALAEALHRQGRIRDAVLLGREVHRVQGTWDRRLLSVVYPLPFESALTAAAWQVGLDPLFVAALVRQESLFQPAIMSSAGAVGLMQLMPATGASLGRRLGTVPVTAETLTDPELNLRLGTTHLADLVRRQAGRVDEVLAAYNAGGSRLARWKVGGGTDDPDLFLERIPFAETREYLRVVQANQAVYRFLFPGLGEVGRQMQ